MKVSDITSVGSSLTYFVVIDMNTGTVLYNEECDGGASSSAYLKCKDLEVVEICVGSFEAIYVYVDAPVGL